LPYAGLQIRDDGTYFDEILAVVKVQRPQGDSLYLRGRFDVPARIYELANSVDARHGQFGQLEVVRTSLKLSLALTLSLVLLVAILGAVYAAFFAAQRLILGHALSRAATSTRNCRLRNATRSVFW
jgi:nitrogen fixation/metabolism regulation signal transduction histidine kinase